jgi:elongation factor P
MINAKQLRVGMLIKFRDDLCRVTSVLHITPGNWRGMVQTKLKSLSSGSNYEHRFRSEDTLERAVLDQKEMQCLYEEGDAYVFMDTKDYEQVTLDKETLGDALNYLLPNTMITVDFFESRAVGVELPHVVELKIIDTEPPMKGATASGGAKPAKLETGVMVDVPQFIEVGETIRVDTRDGKYVERAK